MAERGVLMTVVTRGAKLAEKGVAVPLGVARSIRDEVFRATLAGVDKVDGLSQSTLKSARDLIARADGITQKAMGDLEAAIASLASKAAGEPAQPVSEPEPAEQAEEAPPRPRVAAPL